VLSAHNHSYVITSSVVHKGPARYAITDRNLHDPTRALTYGCGSHAEQEDHHQHRMCGVAPLCAWHSRVAYPAKQQNFVVWKATQRAGSAGQRRAAMMHIASMSAAVKCALTSWKAFIIRQCGKYLRKGLMEDAALWLLPIACWPTVISALWNIYPVVHVW
jgi:hypothetical protein